MDERKARILAEQQAVREGTAKRFRWVKDAAYGRVEYRMRDVLCPMPDYVTTMIIVDKGCKPEAWTRLGNAYDDGPTHEYVGPTVTKLKPLIERTYLAALQGLLRKGIASGESEIIERRGWMRQSDADVEAQRRLIADAEFWVALYQDFLAALPL